MKNQELVEILDEGFCNLCSIFEACDEANNCALCKDKEFCLKVWNSPCSTWNWYKTKIKKEVLALVMSRVERLRI